MSNRNIAYQTSELEKYYSTHRRRWTDFYPSERWIIERIAGPEGSMGQVLDVGCAAGGLGQALSEKFQLDEYVGVEINPQCIDSAIRLNTIPGKAAYYRADVLQCKEIAGRQFDSVFSLSCADWNVRTRDILNACWSFVKPGGHFILTLRLTGGPSLRDISESYQYIWFGESLPDNLGALEKAPYVVLNAGEALGMLAGLSPKADKITAYGYWGPPSSTARTGYPRLTFAAISVRKNLGKNPDTALEAHLPVDIFLPESHHTEVLA